jgi:hypothetical protein
VKDIEKCSKVARILYDSFNRSPQGLFGQAVMPEEVLPKDIERGSNEHLMFITLTVSIDYQRDAPALWESSRRTLQDPSTRWIFSPDEVVKRSDKDLIEAMSKYNLSKKDYKDAIEIWKPVARAFHDRFGSDPRILLEENGYDAVRLYDSVKSRYKSSFPYLSGNKILPLWIRMMYDVLHIELKRIEEIPLPVDIHVARSTFSIGGLRGRFVGTIQEVFNEIDAVWKGACVSIGIYRLQLDEPLWNLSKFGCTYRSGGRCPRAGICPVSQYCVPGKVLVSSNRIEIDT